MFHVLDESLKKSRVVLKVTPHRFRTMETLTRLFLHCLRKIDLKRLRKLGRFLGTTVYHVARKRSRIALKNLDLAYGNRLSREEKIRIAKSSFTNLVTTALEFLVSPRFERPISRLVKVVNPDVFHKAHARGKGTIVIVPHMGNWEISARWVAEQGYRTSAVMRKQKQAWMNRIVSEIRRFNGVREIDKRNGLRSVLGAIRRREVVGMLIDQHARRDAVEVRFFGHPVRTVASTALIARHTGCCVLVGCCFRYPDGSFGVVFSDPLETRVTEDRDADLVRTTQRYISVIESFIRKYPQDWMWMHRRWR